jgi:hypothetical protein
MREMLDNVIQLMTATTRWSGHTQEFFTTETMWYGMTCRTFLLLEQILRSVLIGLSPIAGEKITRSVKKRAGRKGISAMTFGHCFSVLEELAPILSSDISIRYPELKHLGTLLSDSDLQAWKRAVFLRNRLAHKGPGYLDSVDLYAGRLWRTYSDAEPIEQQAREAWQLARRLCESPLIVICLSIQGIPARVTRQELKMADEIAAKMPIRGRESVISISAAAAQAVNEFHVPSKQLSGH